MRTARPSQGFREPDAQHHHGRHQPAHDDHGERRPVAPGQVAEIARRRHPDALREDGDLLNYVNDHRIPIEVCPSSNVQTRATNSWETHPVDFFVDYGVRVTINTDNRLMSDTTVSKELHLCHKHYGWSLQTIKEIIIAGFKSAFMPYREKADLVAEVNKELAKYEDPRGEVTGRVGLVEAAQPASPDKSTSPTPGKAKLQVS